MNMQYIIDELNRVPTEEETLENLYEVYTGNMRDIEEKPIPYKEWRATIGEHHLRMEKLFSKE